MKKTIMSLAVVSVLFSGAAMAAPAANDASTATLNFTGRVTSSLCQVDTSTVEQNISLGEISASALKATGIAPAKSFSVSLVNCDSGTGKITYNIADANASGAAATAAYLQPLSEDDSARGVGVFIQSSDHQDITIGQDKELAVVKDQSGNALSTQTISLAAYMATTDKAADTDGSKVTPGSVSARGVMTIKAAAAN
ncbi:type 1 fimbrial protein [Escherichia coli]|nr:type 1 fimbrial protein [Escherichia coli]EGS8723491.1 type 1 fimbrial protein [Escherichia coli]EHC7952216.1 type 1 fimbrial protein [Escherichia coli]